MNMKSGNFLPHVVDKIYSRDQEPNAVVKAFQIVIERFPGLFPNVTNTLCDGECLGKQTICVIKPGIKEFPSSNQGLGDGSIFAGTHKFGTLLGS